MKENSDPGEGAAGAWSQVPTWLQISFRAGHPTVLSLPLGISDGELGQESR